MQHGIHFISGLSRAGSTLLAGILRQNPRIHAAMTSPVGALFAALLGQMSQSNEFAVFLKEAQRKAILAGLFESYYQDIQAEKLVFDTNRLWCAKLPALATLFPDAKVIACVRDIPWVIDSVERLIQRNKFEPSKIFAFEAAGTVYNRMDGLVGANGMVGYAYNALKEAYYGEHTDRLMLLTYETLTRAPAQASTTRGSARRVSIASPPRCNTSSGRSSCRRTSSVASRTTPSGATASATCAACGSCSGGRRCEVGACEWSCGTRLSRRVLSSSSRAQA